MHLENIASVIINHGHLFLIVITVYLLLVLIGLFFNNRFPKALTAFIKISDDQKTKQAGKMFGKYSELVKKGDFWTISKCILIVFGLNTVGLIQNSFLSALLFPLIVQMGFVGICQGAAIARTKGSSMISLLLYYFVGGLEWITYPIANFTGILFTTSIIGSLINKQDILLPARFNEVVSILFPSILLLFVQAILELLYINKVLRAGGTAIPLEPY
jgi:hypothetical protein